MKLPLWNKEALVRRDQGLQVKDDRLARVLQGRETLLFDGAMGTMLQRRGLALGAVPALLCLSDPKAVTEVHRAYAEAGSQVITTNTFGIHREKLQGKATVDQVFHAAVQCARDAGAHYVAADIGPTGSLLQPLGTLPFDEAYELFAQQMRAAQAAGADLVLIETMADLAEAKAAVLAAKEQTRLPIFATMTFGRDGRTFLGTTPSIAARTLDALGVDGLGINCSLGPVEVLPLVQAMAQVTDKPLILQANAGLPQLVEGCDVYPLDAAAYAQAARDCVDAGVTVLGGCCGTDPGFIAALAEMLKHRATGASAPKPRRILRSFAVTSSQQEVVVKGADVASIGERINPTGKPRLQEALRQGDLNVAVAEAQAQMDAGAALLDVNAGLPDIDEAAVLAQMVLRLQATCPLPLQIDSADPRALEAAVRSYPGIPLINSVNATAASLESILPLAAHYGCAVVGLTLDENGIPADAAGRVALARMLVAAAQKEGLGRHRVAIDCLVMAASSDQAQALACLQACAQVRTELEVPTVLGVSNASFGLPRRSALNATFLAAALGAGLSLPIVNPLDAQVTHVLDAWRVFNGQDAGAAAFIAQAQAGEGVGEGAAAPSGGEGSSSQNPCELVLAGLEGPMEAAIQRSLQTQDALTVVDQVMAALDEVGRRFQEGTYFLPQLMASAAAAKAAFDGLQGALGASAQSTDAPVAPGPIVLATVKGDIHDLGKNIVRMLLQNYGYSVIDLGRDVDPAEVVRAVQRSGAPLVGLSALMTTTLGAMKQTIDLLRQEVPGVRVMVGGAVLNPDYAAMVGADFYAKDAAESARIAASLSKR